MTHAQTMPPDGFMPLVMHSDFVDLTGPYFYRPLADGGVRYGFLTDKRHTNTNGLLHGAAYMGFADTIMGHAVREQVGRNCATVSLHSHFVGSARPGGWLEADLTITRVTRSLAYLTVDISDAGQVLHTASGVFKLFGDLPPVR
ncbi:PaaI family thioesterase [Ferrovibrio sp.]|uniref:PaaI family thioesterase n=1 Tax=Ferrovibrio sp. TaxID=1917215 RepID=UPI0025B7FDB7|nr:PaaI family thioesterase [Ferrovibrio sp.]MBX3455027.1 PaaI family thioesterase [Ferrovibrio sp.]